MNFKSLLLGISISLPLLFTLACSSLGPEEEVINGSSPVENQENTDNGDADNEGGGENAKLASVEDYYPIEKNTNYIFTGQGSEYASYERYVDYISKDRKLVQYREDSPGTTVAKVVEVKDGEVRRVYSREEAYYREDYILNPILRRSDGMVREVLIKEPIEVGNSWTLDDGRKRTITGIDVKVETPSGEYSSLEVRTEGQEYTSKDYYGKGIGHIKSVFESEDGFKVISELDQIERDVPYETTINLYYPDLDKDTYYYSPTPISFNTNDITRINIANLYRRRPENSNLGPVLTRNTRINYLFLNIHEHVYIDLSQDFIIEMNAGAYYESMLLNSIALTFGDYYNQANRLYLSIDGGDYESGHIFMEKGEYMEVDYSNRKVLNQ